MPLMRDYDLRHTNLQLSPRFKRADKNVSEKNQYNADYTELHGSSQIG